MEYYYGLAQRAANGTNIPADWIFAQWRHETNDFTNWGATKANNFGGLKQFKENPGGIDAVSPEGDNYQIFSTPEEYADYFSKYLGLYKENGIFQAKNVQEYAAALKDGGYYGDSVENYTNALLGKIGEKGIFERNFDLSQSPFRDAQTVPQLLPENNFGEASQVAQAKDKFLHHFFDSAMGGGLRALYLDASVGSSNGSGDNSPKPITQEDIKFVDTMFPGDYVTQKFLLMNARNPQHLAVLAQTKKEDIERQQRVENYGYGISTAASVAGMILSDPLTFVPVVGQEALLLKGLSRMGRLSSAVPMAKWAKYAEIAATTGTLNVADRYGAEHIAGYSNQDYTSAFILGAVLGGGLSMGVDAFRHYRDKGTQRIVAATHNAQDHIAAQATGARLPNEVRLTRPDVERIHDSNYHTAFKSENLKTLMDGKKVFAVTKDEMAGLAKKWGVDLKPNAKAFYHDEGYAVLIKDNIKKGENIDDLILHEVGVHGGMRSFVGEDTWSKIMDTVDQNIKKPQGAWKDAVRRSPGGGNEEILAHYIELAGNKDNKLITRMKSAINSKLRESGISKKLSDSELIDFAQRSLKREVDKARGYTLHADGSATMGGLRYSAANAVNPNIIDDVVRTEREVLMDTQGSTGKLAKTGQWFEAGGFSGTLGGILKNSKVKAVADFANTAFHDARMREFKGNGPKPLELQKQEIMQELSVHWHSYIMARDKYIAENMNGSRFGPNADAMRLDFNKEVVDYLNMEYGRHKGNKSKVFDPGIVQAANAYKNLYDAVSEIGKSSASRFGYSHKNMIDQDFKPSTGEIWRVFDPDQRHNAINNIFGDYEKFQKGLEDYAVMFANRSALKKELLEIRQREWDALKVEHDAKLKEHEQAQEVFNTKTLPAYQEKVAALEEKYKAKVDEATKQWEQRVEHIRQKDLERQRAAEERWNQKVYDQAFHDELRWDNMKEQYRYELEFWKLQVSELPPGAKVPKKPVAPKRPSPPLKAQKPIVPASPLPDKPKVNKPQLPEKPIPPVKPKELEPRPIDVTPEELDIHVKARARDYAYGMSDLDISNLHQSGTADSGLSFFKQRFPMDTSGVMVTEKGIPFSFDGNLRSYDLDNITNGVINRFAGEAAFRNAFPNPKDYDKWLEAVSQKHYGKGIDQKMITESEKAKELKALGRSVAMLRGTHPPDDVRTVLEAFAGLTRKMSYSQNGANMGWNQVGESGGAIGYSGLRAVLHVVPALDNFIRGMTKGADHVQALHEVTRHVFGQNAAKEVWKTNWGSRTWHDRLSQNSILRKMDTVESVANYMGKVTNTVNQMQRLTDWMVTGSRAEAIADSVEWAGGKEFSKIRNPFSSSKLKAAGVTDEIATAIKADINKYTSFNSKGYMNNMNVAKWQKESPATFAKWRFLLDNQSLRTIQQATIGNTAYLTSAHGYSTFMKMLFQFKDFSMRAINGSTLRAVTHHEADDLMAALGSMVTNTAVYAGLTYGKSYMYYHDDEKKRKEYLEKQLSPQRLGAAAFLRGVMTGSILGFGGDIATALFGTETFRTTYDNSKNMFKKDRDISDITGDTLGQNPSFRAVESMYRVGNAVAQGIAPHQEVTKREISAAMKAFPLQNALPMLWLNADISKRFPDKDKKDAHWLWK